jgi:hypothetical protein
MSKLSRRELGRMVAALTAAQALPRTAQAQAQAPAPSGYIGPLTGVTGLDGRAFDPVAYTLDLYEHAPRALRFQASQAPTSGQAETWQTALRARVTELIGGFPATKVAFNKVREIYSVFSATDRIEQEVFPDEHSFWGKRGIPFLARHLNA